MRDMQVLLNSIRDNGGVTRVAQNWTDKDREDLRKRLVCMSETLGEMARELEREGVRR